MRYGLSVIVLLALVAGCVQVYTEGEQDKVALPDDCQKLDSVEVFFCGDEGRGVCYKAICTNNGVPVTYLRVKGSDGKWSKYEFYFASKRKAEFDAGAKD